jgi:hypothetical protein
MRLLTATLLMLSFVASNVHADDRLELNIYGLSHHWNRSEAREMDTTHEVNPGLGLRYALKPNHLCNTPFVESGIYRDSGANTSVYAALGCKGLRLTDNVHLGLGLALMQSNTYNNSNPFVAPIPLLTWYIKPVTLNFIQYFRVKSLGILNTTGLYLSVPLP